MAEENIQPGPVTTGGRSRGEGAPVELPGRLRPLADLVPMLEAPNAEFGRWVTLPARDGVLTLPWFSRRAAALLGGR